ncbi:hypothetical protein G7074_24870 [Pedobacter sp. HDW13]|uniref:hypothetical protein n=1 Tax=unclassified Pedobacter TaxID=2628915 RepID=UPI000F5B6A61|nr:MULTISPECIES: hypothetical protein [unclassified Pedobacter]QIL42208.1 hypothetical protein G7074_24870 [Pedobacter sp. HDW13]
MSDKYPILTMSVATVLSGMICYTTIGMVYLIERESNQNNMNKLTADIHLFYTPGKQHFKKDA